MTNTASLFTAQFTIIHTEGCTTAVGFSTSPRKAIRAAKRQAWRIVEDEVQPRNYADEWLELRKGGRLVRADFASDF